MTGRTLLAAVLLITAAMTAGCFGPEDDPAEDVGQNETTPGDTVEAGGNPQGEPENDTAIAEGTEDETAEIGDTEDDESE